MRAVIMFKEGYQNKLRGLGFRLMHESAGVSKWALNVSRGRRFPRWHLIVTEFSSQMLETSRLLELNLHKDNFESPHDGKKRRVTGLGIPPFETRGGKVRRRLEAIAYTLGGKDVVWIGKPGPRKPSNWKRPQSPNPVDVPAGAYRPFPGGSFPGSGVSGPFPPRAPMH